MNFRFPSLSDIVSHARRKVIFLALGLLVVAGTILSKSVKASIGDLALTWSSVEADRTKSVAWGDWDNDGDLDLAVGNIRNNRVYRNENGNMILAWSSVEQDDTSSVAWGDWDNDGDLDLAVGNWLDSNRVYRNDNGNLVLAWSSPEYDDTFSVTWGDWDNDGDLDLAVGNSTGIANDQPNRVYRNDNGNLDLAWSAPTLGQTRSVSWGDYDKDGYLDLAVGNFEQPNLVYHNDGGALSLSWTAPISYTTVSLAWGDYDGDGYLDLAVGNDGYPNLVYRNDAGNLSLVWSAPITDTTNSVAWGDWDNDGDLDLAIGNDSDSNRVYANDNGSFNLAWSSIEQDNNTHNVAWGDWNNDGCVDLVAGNYGLPNQLYQNDCERLTMDWPISSFGNTTDMAVGDWDNDGDLDVAVSYALGDPTRIYRNNGDGNVNLVWTSPPGDDTHSVAWGDFDSDGDLDLAIGNYDQPNRVYRNDIGNMNLAWSSLEENSTRSIAWGDCDGDSDLDLAVGNYSSSNPQPIQLYRNEDDNLILVWQSSEMNNSREIAWGDWDGDGDPDLVAGNHTQPNRVYENDGCDLYMTWESPTINFTNGAAWGDYDSDGDLDLAFGNWWQEPTQIYRNDGRNLTLAWTAPEPDLTYSVTWGDWDNDGDFDLAVGNNSEPKRVYQNNNGNLSLAWSSTDSNREAVSLIWGDWDGDSDLDLITGHAVDTDWIYRNHSADTTFLPDNPTQAHIDYPSGAAAPFFSSATILNGPTLSITYTLTDPETDSARLVKAYYSLDGGSTWQPAIAATGTITTNLEATPSGILHTYIWDVYRSGIFGCSDNVIFRLDVYQGFHGIGPFMYPFRRAKTYPFRVRGSQARVMYNNEHVANAIVYRQPVGQSDPYQPYHDLTGRPFHTDPAGYLQGYGEITIGDHLIAMLPITATESYTLYYTNAAPTLTGLDSFTVSSLGVQTLTVTSTHPLVLFNLDVSLEWDARYDDEYLARLESDLKRTSELLFDWSNGQAALGKINVYHNREHWNEAHVRIYATNRLRPSAAQGGSVTDVLTDILATNVVYIPGQVHIGASWNRFGDPGVSLGEDWPRTLAHELGHYLLFLDDNYLGFDPDGLLIPIENCPGAMSDPYSDDDSNGYDEFHPNSNWLPNCENTLSHQATGRPDWNTIQTFFPWLFATDNAGPNSLPLAVTQVMFIDPGYPSTSLPVPLFYLRRQEGGRYTPSQAARAYLFQGDRLTDLGSPTLDQVLARGVSEGERLCVYDVPAGRLGCEAVTATDETLEMVSLPGWQPEIILTPVTSQTIVVTATLSDLISETIYARLYPLSGITSTLLQLVPVAPGVYQGTFNLVEPSYDGYVHVWVDEGEPGRREAIADYAIGGDPGPRRGKPGSIGPRRGNQAPVVSADGQAILVGKDLVFVKGEFYVLQAATHLPQAPVWVDVIGQGYWLKASAHAPSLQGTSLAFNYMGSQILNGMEQWLRVYYWDGSVWMPLETRRDTYQNIASAPVQGPGLYALFASIEIPLYGPGWNNFPYPIYEAQPITQTLQSINGLYTMVCQFVPTDPANPWRCHDPGALAWADDLTELSFGSYWIHVTNDTILRLKGTPSNRPQQTDDVETNPQIPPAVVYGFVNLSSLQLGDTLTAWVDGNLCGETSVVGWNNLLVYVIDVSADDFYGSTGCGRPGRAVVLKHEDQIIATIASWDNRHFLNLSFGHLLYLPIIRR